MSGKSVHAPSKRKRAAVTPSFKRDYNIWPDSFRSLLLFPFLELYKCINKFRLFLDRREKNRFVFRFDEHRGYGRSTGIMINK